MDKLSTRPIRRSRILAGRVMADAVTMLLQGQSSWVLPC